MEKSDLAAEHLNGAAADVSEHLNEAFNNLRNALLQGMSAAGGIDIPGTAILMRVQFVHLHTLQAHLIRKGLIVRAEIDKELADAFDALTAATKANTKAPKLVVPH